jgi:hypothetical protein
MHMKYRSAYYAEHRRHEPDQPEAFGNQGIPCSGTLRAQNQVAACHASETQVQLPASSCRPPLSSSSCTTTRTTANNSCSYISHFKGIYNHHLHQQRNLSVLNGKCTQVEQINALCTVHLMGPNHPPSTQTTLSTCFVNCNKNQYHHNLIYKAADLQATTQHGTLDTTTQ